LKADYAAWAAAGRLYDPDPCPECGFFDPDLKMTPELFRQTRDILASHGLSIDVETDLDDDDPERE
jgi:hypothetical protein